VTAGSSGDLADKETVMHRFYYVIATRPYMAVYYGWRYIEAETARKARTIAKKRLAGEYGEDAVLLRLTSH
jgi:hypothetical protein